MQSVYDNAALRCSKIITHTYSTSFTLGIRAMHLKYRNPIYAIYGFVRYADEIVDTFHQYKKEELLINYKKETYEAIEKRISLNPVLHSFQSVVNQYQIDLDLVEAFFESMKMDLNTTRYNLDCYQKYIFGSAEAVGLMCLKVFCEGNEEKYDTLKLSARKLGSAFQKVNFLRDIRADYVERGRMYFPSLEIDRLTDEKKKEIIEEIEQDFAEAHRGVMKLPSGTRAGVLLAYLYYLALLKKIKNSSVKKMLKERIRIPNLTKAFILAQMYVRFGLNLL